MKIPRFPLTILAFMTVLLITALSPPARAADVVLAPTPEQIVYDTNWTGAYIKGVAGYESAKSHHSHDNVNNFGGPGGTYNHDGKGFIGGVAAGYQHEFDNHVVLGAELGVLSGRSLDDGGAYGIYNNYTNSKRGPLFTGKVRVGYAMGKVMPYIHGGVAGAKLSTRQVYSPPGVDPTTWSGSKFRTGYTVGAGVDIKVGKIGKHDVIAGLEYAYTDLGTVHHSGNDSSGKLTNISQSYKSHSIMATLAIKF